MPMRISWSTSSVSELLPQQKVGSKYPALNLAYWKMSTASSPLYYITALTALFEGVAMIVDQHQPVVEKYYGPRRMRRVLKTLLQECDRVTKGIVDKWEEERSMKRKVNYFPVLSMNIPIDLFSCQMPWTTLPYPCFRPLIDAFHLP